MDKKRVEGAGERIVLERESAELREGIEIRGECSGEGLRSEAYAGHVPRRIALDSLPLAEWGCLRPAGGRWSEGYEKIRHHRRVIAGYCRDRDREEKGERK